MIIILFIIFFFSQIFPGLEFYWSGESVFFVKVSRWYVCLRIIYVFINDTWYAINIISMLLLFNRLVLNNETVPTHTVFLAVFILSTSIWHFTMPILNCSYNTKHYNVFKSFDIAIKLYVCILTVYNTILHRSWVHNVIILYIICFYYKRKSNLSFYPLLADSL